MSTLPEMEKPRVTEIHVRMDCNGCVQKIKKALHGVKGIYELYIDFPQQKITIIGCADPQTIAKAIKKTRKTAIICSHSEPSDDQPAAQPSEPAPDGGAPPETDGGAPPATEGGAPPPPESTNQPAPEEAEAPKESPPPENPPPQEAANTPTKPKDVEEIHVIYHHPPPPDYRYRYGPSPYAYNHNVHHHQGYGGQLNPLQPGLIREEPPQPTYVTHSYHSYKPSPNVTEYAYNHNVHHQGYGGQPGLIRAEPPQPTYVSHSYHSHRPSPNETEYAYINRPSPSTHSQYYGRPAADQYTYNNSTEEQRSGSNGNITSIFSDENPNACRIA